MNAAHRRRRADGADQGLRRSGVGHAAAGVRVRRADRVRDAADLDPVGVPGAQGRPDDGAVGGRRLRQPGRRLPVGLAGGAGLQADLVAGQHHPAAGAGDDVRAVDGLRDLPADPHPGAVPADQEHPRRRRVRGEHQRPHDHQRRADHDRGVHRVRVRGHAVGRPARCRRARWRSPSTPPWCGWCWCPR